MKMSSHLYKFGWCIVVADDHGPEWAPTVQLGESPSPVQYSRLGGSSTLLQRAMRRAARMAPPSQVMITALDEYREYWEPSVWYVRPENRFVGEIRATSLLTGAAALLSIAHLSPSNVVTILPARCHVAQEWILRAALERALSILPGVREGVVTLGMVSAAAATTGSECEIPMNLQRGVPRPTMKSPRWNPPMFPQRAIPVVGCGWSGLRTQRAVGRVTTYSSIANTLAIQPLQDSHLVAEQG
jgi:hypothetical protein